MWLGEPRSTNPLRIPHPKIDKLACQTQGVGILAKGEITLRAYDAPLCMLVDASIFYHTRLRLSRDFPRKKRGYVLSPRF